MEYIKSKDHKWIDMTGWRVGIITVLGHVGKNRWHYKCDCGEERVVCASSLRKSPDSCGCKPWAHGMSSKKEYKVWLLMKNRCTNPNATGYHRYGGRGINVCQRWSDSFMNFYNDMGDCPPENSIDRIDNDKGYYKENCRWATRIEQSANKSTSKLIPYHGEMMSINGYCRRVDKDPGAIKSRIIAGWPIDKALNEPLGNQWYKYGARYGKLTINDIKDMKRIISDGNMKMAEISKAYKISLTSVYKIKHRQCWANVV